MLTIWLQLLLQGMEAGENTLNAICARLVMRSIASGKGYDPQRFLSDYVTFMTTPGTHNDTYAESFHRDFFKNWAAGEAALLLLFILLLNHYTLLPCCVVPIISFFKSWAAGEVVLQLQLLSNEYISLLLCCIFPTSNSCR